MNNMRNGMIILEQTDENQKAVFIDEEQLDWLKLNAMFKKRDKEKQIADRKNHIVDNRRRKWQHYTINTFTFIGIRSLIMGATVWAMTANLINPIIAIPVALYCLSTASIRFGVWFGKRANRKS